MICLYLFVEYVRPQSIIPALDILPWAKLFLLLSAIGLAMDRNRIRTSDPTNKWITAFLFAIILSCITAKYPRFSWSHFMDFFGWYIIYFLIVNIVTTERRFLIFLAIFFICSFKLSLFGAKTWALRGFSYTSWGLQGPPGFFENSGEFAIQMLMFGPIALELAIFLRPYISPMKYCMALLMPITALMSIMGASSRGAQLALVYQVYRSLLKGRISFKALLLVAAVAYAGVTLLPNEQKARFSAAGSDKTSHQRLLYWRHGIEMIKENPVLGVGFFNFPPYYASRWPEDLLPGPRVVLDGVVISELPHNIFIQIATDTGLVGTFFFLMLIYRTVKSASEIRKLNGDPTGVRKPFRSISRGLVVSMWGFLIAGQFVTVTYYPFFWINLALMISLKNIATQYYSTKAPTSEQSSAIPTFPPNVGSPIL